METLRRLFSIDPRSLAVYRWGLAILLLADIATTASNISQMYTDSGMFPRSEIARLYNPWNWSFSYLSPGAGLQYGLLGLQALAAVGLLVGWRSRIMAILCWILLISFHHRAPAVLSGADTLMRMLLFWGCFLPLGRVWSLDAWLARRAGRGEGNETAPVFNVASAAALLQMALMYLVSAVFKTNGEWIGGAAVAGSLAHDFYATPLGEQLLGAPLLLKLFTWCSFILEWVGPFLLFSLWRPSWMRTLTLLSLALMHVGIALVLEVGLFSHVSIVGLLLFLHRDLWDAPATRRILSRLRLGVVNGGATSSASPSVGFSIPQAFCGVCLGYVLLANLSVLPGRALKGMRPANWSVFASGLGLAQQWSMFDKAPTRDGWYVIEATLADGRVVDLLRDGAPVSWERPARPLAAYPNHRWSKLFREMAYEDTLNFHLFRGGVARWMIRDWNEAHASDEHVKELRFIYCMWTRETTNSAAATGLVREALIRLVELNDGDYGVMISTEYRARAPRSG